MFFSIVSIEKWHSKHTPISPQPAAYIYNIYINIGAGGGDEGARRHPKKMKSLAHTRTVIGL